jgi:AraC family transcriptional regulator
MKEPRIIHRPAFLIAGLKTMITGPDNSQFARFWDRCRSEGLLDRLQALTGSAPGPQTGGITLGVSRVEKDPARRDFEYMIAVEVPPAAPTGNLELYWVPANKWAVSSCWGQIPDSLVEAEIYAFSQWLPSSDYQHGFAPEMEVYPPAPEGSMGERYCEFWLPLEVLPNRETTAS